MPDSLLDFADWLEVSAAEAVEPLRLVVKNMVGQTFADLKTATPVLTGALKEDLSVYSDASQSRTQDVNVAMDRWKPDDEVGIISQLPYSTAIYLGGHSQKFPPGKLDAIIEDGLNAPDREVDLSYLVAS